MRRLSFVVVVVGSLLAACYPDVDPCTVPLGTPWEDLRSLPHPGVYPFSGPDPKQAIVGKAECLPDAGHEHGCRRFLGKPYSGAPCNEGRVGCYVWIQEGVVVGRASRCMN